jgi:hypothetical protein
VTTSLFVFGYGGWLVVFGWWRGRFVRIIRQRRIGWFAFHQGAVASIVTGWAIKGDTGGVIVNGAWLAAAQVWWHLGGRKREEVAS